MTTCLSTKCVKMCTEDKIALQIWALTFYVALDFFCQRPNGDHFFGQGQRLINSRILTIQVIQTFQLIHIKTLNMSDI